MLLWDFLIAFFVAVVFSIVIVGVFGRGRTEAGFAWDSVFITFLVIMLGVWAVGVWTEPVGPQFMGVFWIPPVLGGLFLLFLLLALLPEPEARRAEPPADPEVVTPLAITFTAFIWLALLIALGAIILAYAF